MQQLMQACENLGSSVVACQKLTRAQIVLRNILKGVTTSRDGIYRFLDMEKEKGEAVVGKQAILGRYVLTPDIFEILHRVQPREDGEIKLADALKLMASRQSVYECELEGKRYAV